MGITMLSAEDSQREKRRVARAVAGLGLTEQRHLLIDESVAGRREGIEQVSRCVRLGIRRH